MSPLSAPHEYIQRHYAVPEQADRTSRMTWLKNTVSRCVAHFTRGQVEFNANVVRTIDQLHQQVENLTVCLDSLADQANDLGRRIERSNANAGASARELTAAVENAQKLQDHHGEVLATIDRRLGATEFTIGELRDWKTAVMRNVDDLRSSVSGVDKRQSDIVTSFEEIAGLVSGLAQRQDDVVRSFERIERDTVGVSRRQDDLFESVNKLYAGLAARQGDLVKALEQVRAEATGVSARQDELVASFDQLVHDAGDVTRRQDELVESLEQLTVGRRQFDAVRGAHERLAHEVAEAQKSAEGLSQRQSDLVDSLEAMAADFRGIDKRQSDLVALMETLSKQLGGASKQAGALAERVGRAEDGFSALQAHVTRADQYNLFLKNALDNLLALLPAGKDSAAAAETAGAAAECRALLSDSAYEEFEEAQRGEEKSVTERLAFYADILAGRKPAPRDVVLDIGCGRGEFLALLAARNVNARGIDVNRVAVKHARAAGLAARRADAFAELARCKPGSLAAVSAFHVLEHFAFTQIVEFVKLVYAALAPGGLLLLETPNALNLFVAASDFVKDPSHVRLVHPVTLKHWLAHVGFTDIDVTFRNPFPEAEGLEIVRRGKGSAATRNFTTLNNLIFGSRDCAVIAAKPNTTPARRKKK